MAGGRICSLSFYLQEVSSSTGYKYVINSMSLNCFSSSLVKVLLHAYYQLYTMIKTSSFLTHKYILSEGDDSRMSLVLKTSEKTFQNYYKNGTMDNMSIGSQQTQDSYSSLRCFTQTNLLKMLPFSETSVLQVQNSKQKNVFQQTFIPRILIVKMLAFILYIYL